MNAERGPSIKLRELCVAALDGSLNPDEAERFDTALRTDAEARVYYVRLARLISLLETSQATPEVVVSTPSRHVQRQKPQPQPSYRIYAIASGIAAALLAACGLGVLILALSGPPTDGPNDDSVDIPVATLIESSEGANLTTPGGFIAEGRDYGPGEYTLDQGTAEFMLTNSVNVKLRGQTSMSMHNDMHVSLASGSAEFVCPASAKGFTVHLPDGTKIIDLGTRFRVRVGDDGTVTSRVLSGRVRVEPTTGEPISLAAGEGVRIANTGAAITSLPTLDPEAVLSDDERDERWSAYLAELAESDDAFIVAPLDGVGMPLVGASPANAADASAASANRFGRDAGAMRFDSDTTGIRYPMGWPEGDYTVAAWVRPTGFEGEGGYVVAVQSNERNQVSHLFRIVGDAISAEVFETHSTIRGATVHRVTGPSLTADRWTHLVMTHRMVDSSNAELSLYVDGVEAGSQRYPLISSRGPLPRNLTVGARPNRDQAEWSFKGDLDDLVLISRAVEQDEAAELYELSRPDQHLQQENPIPSSTGDSR